MTDAFRRILTQVMNRRNCKTRCGSGADIIQAWFVEHCTIAGLCLHRRTAH